MLRARGLGVDRGSRRGGGRGCAINVIFVYLTMTVVQSLKQHIHTAVEAETSEDVLVQIQHILDKKYPLVSEEIEAGIAEGIADLEAGRKMSLAEFKERGKREAAERKLKYGE